MHTAGWVGWVWDHATGDWLSVCHDRDIAPCHRQLIAWCQAEGVPMRDTLLTGGHRPWDRPPVEGRGAEAQQ